MSQYTLKNLSGFTMVEIVVSVVIFALSIAGLLSAISSLNRPAVESFEEVQAAYIGKQILEELRQGVDAASWDQAASILAPTPLDQPVQDTITQPEQAIDFNTSYTISADPAGGRWVDLTISWE